MNYNAEHTDISPRAIHQRTVPSCQQGMQKVAIIGGMGPDAGVDLISKFLIECRIQLKSRGLPVIDQLYPPHLLIQYPIPDRSLALLQGGLDPLDDIVAACKTATGAGATTLGIACNTAHLWYPQIAAANASATVLHMADIAALAVARAGFRRTALMATPVTCSSRLYHDALGRHGIEVIDMSPSECIAVETAIFDGVKAGDHTLAQRLATRVARDLLLRADSVLLACTELPVALQRFVCREPKRLVDASAALAAALADSAFRACESTCR